MGLDEVIPIIWRPLNKRMLAGILGREPSEEELDAWLAERASYCPECGRPFEKDNS